MTTTITHVPLVQSFPRTQEQPAEVTVTCTCGGYLFESQESAGGGLEDWGTDFDAHVEEVAG